MQKVTEVNLKKNTNIQMFRGREKATVGKVYVKREKGISLRE